MPTPNGFFHTKETRLKMSLSHMGHATTNVTRQKLREATLINSKMRGNHHSDITKLRISVTLKGRPMPPNVKQKIIDSGTLFTRCHTFTSETLKRMSEARHRYLTMYPYYTYGGPSPYKYTFIEKEVEGILLGLGKLKNYDFFHNMRIKGTRYFGDFVLPAANKIIECDGRYWHEERLGAKESDKRRDMILTSFGYDVLHLPEMDIRNKLVKDKVINFVNLNGRCEYDT